MALGALRVAQIRKIKIPQQLAVAGFDDAPASRFAWPELTTVRQPMIALGSRAISLLLEGSAKEEVKYELIIRGSTVERSHRKKEWKGAIAVSPQ